MGVCGCKTCSYRLLCMFYKKPLGVIRVYGMSNSFLPALLLSSLLVLGYSMQFVVNVWNHIQLLLALPWRTIAMFTTARN